ncbi:hypothetical protein AAG570_008032 [Ranatra chinensis]|uniref:VWA N-terminal domain-containing protein n=1 Tax=Ranatra chinensis TaxID=642074 RepID=A0ABD0YFC9_9HEMI
MFVSRSVEQWANKLGEELWELGLSVTKAPEIKTTYKKLNARVLPTDGEGILNTIVSNVNRLLKMKMDSVMCIIDTAEELGEEFTSIAETKYSYYSAKYSLEPGGEPSESEEELGIDRQMYKEIQLTPDQAFYGIPVNTTHSAVHVPTDVDDQSNIFYSLFNR